MDTGTTNIVAKTRVVIVGGGFAGLNCAQKLASIAPHLRITLIDKNNYQQFQPLLYQVATGILSPENAAFNLRDVFLHRDRVEVVMSEIETVDLTTRTVTGKRGDVYQADFLVLAAGAQANFFGIPGAEHFTYPMYSLRDAERLRSRLLEIFEETNVKTGSSAPSDLHFRLVGGICGSLIRSNGGWKLRWRRRRVNATPFVLSHWRGGCCA